MARIPIVKCQQCGVKQKYDDSTMTYMVKEYNSGRKIKKYYHNDCIIEYEKAQKYTDKEVQLLDDLVEFVGSLHQMPKPKGMAYQLPRSWYHIIQDIRNGTDRYTKRMKKRYKKGISYEIILEAYKMSQDAIKWSKMDRQFKDTLQELRYGLAVVNNKIPDALKKAEREKRAKEVAKAKAEQLQLEHQEEREVSYKKKNFAGDISDFLD